MTPLGGALQPDSARISLARVGPEGGIIYELLFERIRVTEDFAFERMTSVEVKGQQFIRIPLQGMHPAQPTVDSEDDVFPLQPRVMFHGSGPYYLAAILSARRLIRGGRHKCSKYGVCVSQFAQVALQYAAAYRGLFIVCETLCWKGKSIGIMGGQAFTVPEGHPPPNLICKEHFIQLEAILFVSGYRGPNFSHAQAAALPPLRRLIPIPLHPLFRSWGRIDESVWNDYAWRDYAWRRRLRRYRRHRRRFD